MTPQQELERLLDLSGIKNVMFMLSIICGQRAINLAQHDAHAAKEWDRYASGIDHAIIKIWGRL